METERRRYPDVVQERSFSFRPGSSSIGRSTSRKRDSQTGPARPSRANLKTIPRPWTVKFFCLSSRYFSKIPTTSEREILENAGLGFKKIKLDLSDNEEEVLKKLTSGVTEEGSNVTAGYPQLKSCGGFELLTCLSNSRDLKVLKCSMYAKDIKAKIDGGQGRISIRPIQKNLSTTKIVKDSQSTLKEKCLYCEKEIPLTELRSHVIFCNKESDSGSDDDSVLETSPFLSRSDDLQSANLAPQSICQQVLGERDNLPQQQQQQAVYHIENIDLEARFLSPATVPRVSDLSTPVELQTSPDLTTSTELTAVTELHTELDFTIETELPKEQSLKDKVKEVARSLKKKNLDQNPVEILRAMQRKLISGRKLGIENAAEDNTAGETNFIMVDRNNILETGFDETMALNNKFITLEVQFYDEQAKDYGGPRKEFFLMMMREIREKYFQNGLRQAFRDDYRKIGISFGLSILQNGKVLQFMDEAITEEIVFSLNADTVENDNRTPISELRRGLKEMGIVQESSRLTVKKLILLLKPDFDEEGSNTRMLQDEVYTRLLKYVREVASGRRGNVNLQNILAFVTGADEEPLLGFEVHPSILFVDDNQHFTPKAQTCINQLILPRGTSASKLPDNGVLFNLYDYAFWNNYFGLI
eukprot:gene12462-13751_t